MANSKAITGDNLLRALQYMFFIVLLLYFGKPLFIPLSVALFICFILYPACKWLENHHIPQLSAILISLFLFLLTISAIIALLGYQFSEFMKEWPALSGKLETWIQTTENKASESWMKVFIKNDKGLIESLMDYFSAYILPLIPSTIYQSSVSLVLIVLIPVYVVLILYYRRVLVSFLYEVFPKSASHYIKTVLPDVIITYYKFIKGMGIVYLVVGILNSIGLALLGIPNPVFFGFVASILTFIPYLGITMGALLPMAVSWLKYDSILYPIGVVLIFAIVQVLEANIIFPLAVSRQLKINALITLIVIIAGGIIWGVIGMVLFVPFTAILKLIADQVPEMKPISILLGTKDEVELEANIEKQSSPKIP
ncbi:AI-2E family transporter [Mangrovivirga sp. M17]|uniref:AI-2E family transporter n=1 Tax=Mangrovivirga halotolerans TaxID=2993936 RepID=A0ABT3RQD0_9BACT|nr:AI-2E family transporter [Mangrovivirga halotolerans]MCX2743820.1 AI-2E family transporter [Mangrovivirga halotolerans]